MKNPIKTIKDFIVEDVKSDFKAIKDISKSKTIKIDWSKLSLKTVLEKNWLMWLMIMLAFFCGYFYAMQGCQDTCNQFILNNYVNISAFKTTPFFP